MSEQEKTQWMALLDEIIDTIQEVQRVALEE
jgi:hypothetical protein